MRVFVRVHLFATEMEDPILTPATAQEFYEREKWNYLTTGCSSIDQCLKGGLVKESINEVWIIGRNE